MLTDTDKALYRAEVSPTTDAQSGSTLNGSAWLRDLLQTGIAGYVAVETVRNQNRNGQSVTTGAIPRVSDKAAATTGINWKAIGIAAGILALFGLVAAYLRRR